MELTPNESLTDVLQLGLFMTYLDIVLKISLVVLVIVSIVAIIYGIILLRQYVNAYKEKESTHKRM